MQVRYPTSNNKKTNFTQEETANPPEVRIENPEGLYTLVMIDPDAGKKSEKNARPGNSDKYYLHWLVINIPATGNINEGDDIVPYAGPTPPPNTGSHEYIFILYRQKVSLMTGLMVKERPQWSLNGFLQGKELTEVKRQSVFVPKRQKLNATM